MIFSFCFGVQIVSIRRQVLPPYPAGVGGKMSVPHGHFNLLVPHYLLHGPQIRPMHDQLRAERMAQVI
jgi:hypothetical protein